MNREEETTPVEGQRQEFSAESVPPASSEAELLGRLLAAGARQQTAVNALSVQVGTLSRELSQFGRDLKDDKVQRVETAKHASKVTSNRMAALLGTLFVLYQEAAPVLHEVWAMVRHWRELAP